MRADRHQRHPMRAYLTRLDRQLGRAQALAERERLLPPRWMRLVWRAVWWLLAAIALWVLAMLVLTVIAAVLADLATRP